MKTMTLACALIGGLAMAEFAYAQAVIGQAAPTFSAQDVAGKTVSLAEHKGKYVVLEWVNPDCPFVKKHYNSGNMPATQKHAAAKGAVWLSVNTSDGKADAGKLASWAKEKQASPAAILLDNGSIAKAYGARTTPHMYLIDPSGKLVYAGAIDSKPSSDAADIPGSTNYLTQAIDEATSGKPISRPATKPYGCAVKYASAG